MSPVEDIGQTTAAGMGVERRQLQDLVPHPWRLGPRAHGGFIRLLCQAAAVLSWMLPGHEGGTGQKVQQASEPSSDPCKQHTHGVLIGRVTSLVWEATSVAP